MKAARMGPCDEVWRRIVRQGAIIVVVVCLLLLAPVLLSSPASSAAQPRPTLTPVVCPTCVPCPACPPCPLPPSGAAQCESIYGKVINLESEVGAPDQAIHFTGPIDNWFVGIASGENGDYAFGRLGVDAGFLNLYIPEDGSLHRVTTDIAIAPVPGQCIVANLGFYRTVWKAPPLAPTLRAEPTWAQRGQEVVFVVRVQNQLPYGITEVAVTDYLPEAFLLTNVTTDRGGTQRVGNYGAAFIGNLQPLESATVRFVAVVAADATAGTVRNQVSLLYREHAAAQASASVTIGGVAPPATATSGAAPAATPAAGSSDGEDDLLVSRHGGGLALLPVTGYGLTAIGAGIALGITALAARRARQKHKRLSEEEPT